MKKHISSEVINELAADTRRIIATATLLKMEDPGDLLQQPAPGQWSVIEILEHLNSYGRYYLLEIERSMTVNKPAKQYFTPGWLGNYFTRLMRPSDDGVVRNKMQAFKAHRPAKFLDAFPVLSTFIEHQYYLLHLLEVARQKDIGSIRVPISIARFIRLKLGDVFGFFVAHQQRHFVQIFNSLEQVRAGKVQVRVIENIRVVQDV